MNHRVKGYWLSVLMLSLSTANLGFADTWFPFMQADYWESVSSRWKRIFENPQNHFSTINLQTLGCYGGVYQVNHVSTENTAMAVGLPVGAASLGASMGFAGSVTMGASAATIGSATFIGLTVGGGAALVGLTGATMYYGYNQYSYRNLKHFYRGLVVNQILNQYGGGYPLYGQEGVGSIPELEIGSKEKDHKLLEKAKYAEYYMQGIVEQIYLNRMKSSLRPLGKKAIIEALQIANLEGVLCPYGGDLGLSDNGRHYLSIQDIVSFTSESDLFFDFTDRFRKKYTNSLPSSQYLYAGEKASLGEHATSAVLGLLGGVFTGPIVVILGAAA